MSAALQAWTTTTLGVLAIVLGTLLLFVGLVAAAALWWQRHAPPRREES